MSSLLPAPAGLLAQQAVHTERDLVLLGGWDPWVQVLVGVLAVLVLGLTFYNYRRLFPIWRRFLLLGLRAAVVVLLVAMFYQPALLEERVAEGRNLVVVLVDTSQSMSLPHGDEARMDLARDFLRERGDLWERLSESNDVVFHAFGDEVRDLPDPRDEEGAAGEIRATDRHTRILEALTRVRTRYRNHDLGAVLLLTDGIDTTPDGRRARPDAAAQAVLRDLDAPVVPFTLPDDGNLRDVSVAEVSYNNFAFVMNATSLEAVVKVHGYDKGQLTARLLENGREVSRRTVDLEPGRSEYPLSFEFVPRELGKQVYAVTVSHLDDEVYGANNARQVIVKVIRDKIRVLQIVGQPSWDERFLRNHLKEDPNVDLISFFILINRNSYRPVGPGETSLIPFPAEELFEEELGGFDLAIFQNFDYGPFQTRKYLPRVAQYVRDGGAFLMVGGPKSFASGGYYGTEITDVLPVDIPPGFGNDRLLDTEEFGAELTEAGEHHPITRLAMDPAVNEKVWEGMEPLQGVNLVSRAKPSSVVLLEHPSVEDQTGAPLPVAAVREAGDGRAMSFLTDSTWHWSFIAGNKGKDTRHYDTFWTNAIRWLIKDPEMDLVRVRVLQERVSVGDEADAKVHVYRPDYRPATDQPVEVVVRRRDAGTGAGEGEVILSLPDAKTDAAGVLDVSIPFEEAGIYEVIARSDVVSGRTAEGIDLFVGTDVNPEFETVIGDGRLLDQVAAATGGRVQSLTTDEPEVDPHPPRVSRVLDRQHDELWNAPWVLAAVALLFGLEWWLRRRYGYL
ncbi:MAG: glutamine amidotransferase [Myxococcota bacterium]